jgi:hypothetical protein
VEDEQFIRMGGGLKEIADRAHAEGAGEEFNIKAAAATLRVILLSCTRTARETWCAEGGGAEKEWVRRVVAVDSTKDQAIRCHRVRIVLILGSVWHSARNQAMARTEFLMIRLRPA